MAKRGRKTNAERERMRLELEEQERLAQEEPEAEPGLTDRQQIYQQYEEQNPQPETAPEEVVQEPEPEEVKEPEPEPTPVEVEEEKKEEVKPETEEDAAKLAEENRNLKAALKEARIKAKEKKLALEEQLAAYEKKNPDAREEDPEPIYDLEARIREQDSEIQDLKSWKVEQSEKDKQQQMQEAERQFRKSIDKVDKELEEEGFGGFRLLVGKVHENLSQMIKTKIDESDDIDVNTIVRQYDNPDTWKKIYKEQVHPLARDIIVKTDKSKVLEEKRQAKAQANLIQTAGKNERPKEEQPLTEQEVLAQFVQSRRADRL